MLLHFLTMIFLGLGLLCVGLFLGFRLSLSRSKSSPFECGFDFKDSSRMPFSLRFFLLAVVFLIFDIEVALLFPLILGLKFKIMQATFVAGFIFLTILVLGLFHEWMEGSLSWIM